ncbi:MAG: hypothetical protein J5671_04770 [Bacteroidaceae bacterium]|nr:hypothetical protein [Bacteroidaceae bacterium]
MKHTKFTIVLLLAMLPLLAMAKGKKDTRLVIISIDGLRWQEVFSGAEENLLMDSKQVRNPKGYRELYWRNTPEERRQILMPFVWSTVAQKGILIGNRDKNSMMDVANKTNISYPGYCEMMTGMVDDAITSNNPVDNPHRNVLEAANEDARYKGKVVMYGSWQSTRYAIHNEKAGIPACVSYEPNVCKKQTKRLQMVDRLMAGMPHYWRSEHFDAFTYAYALETLLNDHPKVMWISFGDCDEWGHSRKYDLYLDGANATDAFIRDIYQTLESNRFYRGKTTYIITCDHGRGFANEWANHGSSTKGSDATWFMMLGKGVEAKGETSECGPFYTKQIAATIANVLGITFTPDDGAQLSPIVQ